MGQIIERICNNCGYTKKFLEGSGLNGVNLRVIRTKFQESKIEEFFELYNNKNVSDFILTQETGHCSKCKDLETENVLTYTLTNGFTIKIHSQCPKCGDKLIYSKELVCPICGNRLDSIDKGLWD